VLSAGAAQRLYRRSGATRWGLSLDAFTARLTTCVAKRLHGEPTGRVSKADSVADTLQVEDIALACACAQGHEAAWEHFIRELRPSLYAAARAMTSSAPEELADSLFAELFGLETREGTRRSLLDYYHGRARLSTWLRTVLAQRHVDALRASVRMVSLDGEESPPEPADPAPAVEPGRDEHLALVQRSLDAALQALGPQERLRLRLYYGQGLKLAQIGRLLHEHEATVSRKVERARRDIRRTVEQALRHEHGLSEAAVEECLRQAAGAPELDISRALAAGDG
jgi:RNA polymerase sigma-70 factor (ECF subfamily)